jgi:hypothetical protein
VPLAARGAAWHHASAMKTIFYFFALTAIAIAQEPLIVGHHIGESIQEFLSAENANDAVPHCEKVVIDEKVLAQLAKNQDCENRHLLTRFGTIDDRCIKLGASPDVTQGKGCQLLLSAVKSGSAVKVGATIFHMNKPGWVSFDQNRLVQMELDFWNMPAASGVKSSYSFDSVYTDFTARLGEPDKKWSEEFQNGYGARYSYQRAMWTKANSYIFIGELQGDSVTALLSDKSIEDKKQADAAATHKNALDR